MAEFGVLKLCLSNLSEAQAEAPGNRKIRANFAGCACVAEAMLRHSRYSQALPAPSGLPLDSREPGLFYSSTLSLTK